MKCLAELLYYGNNEGTFPCENNLTLAIGIVLFLTF